MQALARFGSAPRAASVALVLGALVFAAPAQSAGRPVARRSVVGGQSAQPGSWPWVTRVTAAISSDRAVACSGTLVAPNIVLTAAHCAVRDDLTISPPSAFAVETGSVDHDASAGQEQAVSSVLVHPAFDPGSLRDDVALLVLDAPASAPAIGLATGGDAAALAAPGTRASFAGWGLTAGGGATVPDTLQTAETSVQADGVCGADFGRYDAATMLCVADTPAYAAGACQGDSGGPVVAQRADGTWLQVGVTSWGSRSCDPRLPAVAVRASAVAGWIAGQIAANPPRPAAVPGAPATAEQDDERAPAVDAIGGRGSIGGLYRGRISAGSAIAVRIGRTGRTVTAVRVAGSVCGVSAAGAPAVRAPRDDGAGLAGIGAGRSFALAGTERDGVRYRIAGRVTLPARLVGTLRLRGVDGRMACAGGSIRWTARRSTAGQRNRRP